MVPFDISHHIISSCDYEIGVIGEDGSDTGGLTREFFTVLAKSLSPKYIDSRGCFKHNSIALQVCSHKK